MVYNKNMPKPFLSVVIPAYNEEHRLPTTLIAIDKYLSSQDYSYEVLVVNDASTDRTAEVAQRFSETMKNVRLVSYDQNKGKGGAVKTGMLEARGTYRLFTDADNSTSIDHFEKMLPHFKAGYDVVICSRDLKESVLSPPQPWYKRVLGRMGNLIVQPLLLPGLKDTQCGFKAFTEEAARDAFNRLTILRWGFDIEALALAKHMGYRIKEIPVVWVNDPHSKVQASSYAKTLLEVFKIRFNFWFRKYNIKKVKAEEKNTEKGKEDFEQ